MLKLVWIGFFAMLTAAPASAQTAIPDLRGTWKGESESIILGAGNPHHAATPSDQPRLNKVAFTVTIDKQDGPNTYGATTHYTFALSNPAGISLDPAFPVLTAGMTANASASFDTPRRPGTPSSARAPS